MLTPRLKRLLIVAGILSAVSIILTLLAPSLAPSVACVYQSPSGEVMKGWGKECYEQPGAIVLKAD